MSARMWDAVVSVDLGQRHDFTAIAVGTPLRWTQPHEEPRRLSAWGCAVDASEAVRARHGVGWVSPLDLSVPELGALDYHRTYASAPSRPPLAVPHLDRVRGESYVAVVDRVERLVRSFAAHLEVQLVVDAAGVGRGPIDLLRERGLRPAAITATGGDRVTGVWGDVRVPKRELVSSTQLALSSGLLRVSPELPLAQVLVDELVGYQVRISEGGHDSYEARSGQHDDLVYATTQMCWAFYWFFRRWFEADAAHRRPSVA